MRSRSHVVRHLLRGLLRLQRSCRGSCRWARPRESCAFDMTCGDSVSERRQVMRTDARRRLESGGELNQGRFAECRSKKADAERRAEDNTGGYMYNRISRCRSQARRPTTEVLPEKHSC